MKSAIGPCFLVLTTLGGCSVDVSKLRTTASAIPDAATDQSADRPMSEDLGASYDAEALRDQRIVGEDAGDAEPLPDTSDFGDATVSIDVSSPADAPPTSDVPEDDVGVLLDAPQASPDVPQVSPDAPQTSLDVEPSVADAAGVDLGLDLQANDTASSRDATDVAAPSDVGVDAGGRGNGSPCTSADQCQSGFCVGNPGACCVQGCTSVCYRPNECTMGACVPARGTLTCGDQDALCGLAVNDATNARDWSLQTDLQVGDLAVGSDEHRLTDVPPELAGSPWIRPSRLSKSATANPLVTFNISAPADVYVGVDTRVATPSWLSSWTNSGLTIAYRVLSSSEPPSTVTQRLFRARFPAGSVALGPLACTATSSCSMYLTIIRFADQPAGVPPSCAY